VCSPSPRTHEAIPTLTAPARAPVSGHFFVHTPLEQFGPTAIDAVQEAAMAHWRKRNPTVAKFKKQLTCWAIAVSALAGTLLVLSVHGHV
jgi:hypothetical protein